MRGAGDGSAWIWNTAAELFPHAIQILDRFHVKQTLHRTAQSIFGAPSDDAKEWATMRCAELDDGKLQAIVHALRPHASCAEAAKCMMYILRIAPACDTRNSMPKVYALPPAFWRLAAKC